MRTAPILAILGWVATFSLQGCEKPGHGTLTIDEKGMGRCERRKVDGRDALWCPPAAELGGSDSPKSIQVAFGAQRCDPIVFLGGMTWCHTGTSGGMCKYGPCPQ